MSMWSIPSELWARLLRDGPITFSRGAIRAFRERLLPNWQVLYWVSARRFLHEVPPAGLSLEVVLSLEELSEEAMSEFEKSIGRSAMPRVRERLKAGCELQVLRFDGELAGTRFVVYGASHPFHHAPLTGDDAALLDLRIEPRFRGHRLASLFLRLTLARLALQGIDRVWAPVRPGNVRIIRMVENLGFQERLRFRHWLGLYAFRPGPLS